LLFFGATPAQILGRPAMLYRNGERRGFTIVATDGEIGSIEDI
jgi:hypothetical protein